jgi:hypothetical protein
MIVGITDVKPIIFDGEGRVKSLFSGAKRPGVGLRVQKIEFKRGINPTHKSSKIRR